MNARGQATVELALCLPVVAVLLAALLQAGLIVSDQTRLWHAAREAARTAVVDPDRRNIMKSAESSGLTPVAVSVQPEAPYRSEGRPLRVSLTYRPRSIVPLLDPLVRALELHASVTMRIEQP